MTRLQLLIANALHYWRTNLAVLLGVAAATAVIGGALIVGDSVRASLRQMSLDRLGQIDHLVTGPRFFQEELATSLQADHADTTWAPAIVMQGTLEFGESRDSAVRAGHLQVYGVDERAWDLLDHHDLNPPQPGELVINRRVADQLQLSVGATVTLIVEIPASIPRDALLGDREEIVTALDLTVTGIAEDATGLSRLGFNPTQQLPLNVFLSLDELQEQTGLAEVTASKRNPVAKPARINTLLIADQGRLDPTRATELTQQLSEHLELADLALKLQPHSDLHYLSLESEQMLLERNLAETAQQLAAEHDIPCSPILVYLLNEMWNVNDPDKYSMYSVVAGVDLATLPEFDFRSSAVVSELREGEAMVNTWLAEDLDVVVGDRIGVKYHTVGDRGQLPEESQEFEIAAIVQLVGTADDRGFTPDVPGITDAETYSDWREPFPLQRDRITDRDDKYLEEFRTTPKVFVGLETAQQLWRSRYGELTSLRFTPAATESLSQLSDRYEQLLLDHITPDISGLLVQPIKHQGLLAAQGTTDFTGLFIGFSFFLILSATLLVGLLF
ncbi:MAG: ABC transporter permease, partial [Planctomycetaceae bacterium]|nr:ABC transporter permease [Planctomycetaceae bacterium]